MALTLADYEQMKDDLETAIYSGAKKVEFKDRTVEYQSIDQMKSAFTGLENKIATLKGCQYRTVINPVTHY